jgi:universal stress protein family protein
MSIFPTRILLATDGSENVTPATGVAVQLSKATGSELHLVYVGEDAYSATLIYPETTEPRGVEREDPVLLEQLQRQFEQMSCRVLETEAEKVREAGGGGHPDTPEGGKGGRGDSRASGGAGRRTRGGGQPRFGRDQEVSYGQCLRFGRPSCLLPSPGCAQGRRVVGVAAALYLRVDGVLRLPTKARGQDCVPP